MVRNNCGAKSPRLTVTCADVKGEGTMSNHKYESDVPFCVYVDGIVYSEHPYVTQAVKAAMSVANIFPEADIEVVSKDELLKPAAAAAA